MSTNSAGSPGTAIAIGNRTKSRPGCATLTVGKESVTLDPTLPREEFDRRAARWDELALRAFRK